MRESAFNRRVRDEAAFNAGAIAPRSPKDFAARLMGSACTDEAIAHTDARSGYALEQLHHPMRKFRGAESGPGDTGGAYKRRQGAHVPTRPTLSAWAAKCPSVGDVARSPLWSMLRMRLGTRTAVFDALDALIDDTFWIVHQPWPMTPKIRVFAAPPDRASAQVLQGLVLRADFDSLAALIALICHETLAGRDEDALRVASYVPVAAAVLCLRPGAARVGPLIFARVRQLYLDDMRLGSTAFRLHDYDLQANCVQAPADFSRLGFSYSPPVRRYSVRKGPDLPPPLGEWIEAHRVAPVPRRPGPTVIYAPGILTPAQHCAALVRDQRGFHALAWAEFNATLKEYWDATPSVSVPAGHVRVSSGLN